MLPAQYLFAEVVGNGSSSALPFSFGGAAHANNQRITPWLRCLGWKTLDDGQRSDVGGVGKNDLWAVAGGAVAGGNNIVALADVDWAYAAATFKTHDRAKQFKDFRQMVDAMEKQIDAVVAATPDHTHAVATIAAIRRGKHVYCEKPLAHSVHEVRWLMKAAKEHNVVTQLGNQGHSWESIRLFCEWIWDGAIGKVHTVHCGSTCTATGMDALDQLSRQHKVPESLDWDLWLAPARQRPFCPAYHPFKWRGWMPFGNGVVGDWPATSQVVAVPIHDGEAAAP